LVPALAEGGDLEALPEGFVLDLVVNVEVVDVEPTDVTDDLLDAVVAPVVVHIPDDVTMDAGCSTVVQVFPEIRSGECVDPWNESKEGVVGRGCFHELRCEGRTLAEKSDLTPFLSL